MKSDGAVIPSLLTDKKLDCKCIYSVDNSVMIAYNVALVCMMLMYGVPLFYLAVGYLHSDKAGC